jgi:HAD superfamily hydrolase (TIGR01509 family)
MTKALIFDMDGTIVDNIAFHNRARLLFLEKYGIKLQPDELSKIHSISTKKLVEQYISTNLSRQEIKELDNEKQLIYRNLYKNHIREIQGFSGLLNDAKNKGMLIALSTMGCWANIDLVINTLGVKKYFDVIVSGDDVKKGKPHPDIYNLTLSLLNINSKEAIVFEDTYNGVLSARQAGISVVGVCTSHSKKEFNNWGVTECIDNFDEYFQRFLLKGLNSSTIYLEYLAVTPLL